MIGKVFHYLTVVNKSERKNKAGHQYFYECLCICGNVRHVHQGNLAHGISKSCGCFRRERTVAANRRRRGSKYNK